MTKWMRPHNCFRYFHCFGRIWKLTVFTLFWLTPIRSRVKVFGVKWKGSTTVGHTVVWRSSVVWCTWGNTALWFVGKYVLLYVPNVSFHAMGYFKPIIALHFPTHIKPRNFATRQCERQRLTPPIESGYTSFGFRVMAWSLETHLERKTRNSDP
jgi:hypothetical protein